MRRTMMDSFKQMDGVYVVTDIEQVHGIAFFTVREVSGFGNGGPRFDGFADMIAQMF